MTKKRAKTKSKATGKKTGKKGSKAKARRRTDPAEVRKEVSKMVESEATSMAQAVIDEGKKGQLATVKYLFEMASIYPPTPDGEQATREEDCLAKLLLSRISPPKKAAEGDEEAGSEAPRQAKADEGDGTGEDCGGESGGTPAPDRTGA
jgi:hypothetical protein